MGLRFRKSIKLAPGIKMNFSGSGLSWTFGPKGASISVGKKGTYLNTGIPGTGMYARERIIGSGKKNIERASSRGVQSHVDISVTIEVLDDGEVIFKDFYGDPLPAHLVNIAKRQQGDAIRNLIKNKCKEINAEIEALGQIHFYTPNPFEKPAYQQQEFPEDPPQKPTPKKIGIWSALFKYKREKVEVENLVKEQEFEKELSAWQAKKQEFDKSEQQRKDMIERRIYSDMDAMERFLEENLQGIIWPRETIVSTEILNEGERVFLDVDLPEIEDMPKNTACVPQRLYKLNVKEMPESKIQLLYLRHVHGIGFRIIGETFSALPRVKEVILSAYSQRPDHSTGHTDDEYLYSLRVDRNLWQRINFDNLKDLDVVAALGQFDIRRNMAKDGRFKRIEPFCP